MKSVTRKQLSRKVSDVTGLSMADIDEVLKKAFLEINNFVAEGKVIQLRRFGTFIFRLRKAKTIRSPRNQEEFIIPAHYDVVFIPAQEMRNAAVRLAKAADYREDASYVGGRDKA